MGMSYACWKAHYAAQKYYEGVEKKRQRRLSWFKEEFLPSVASRIGKNPQYPDSCIVSDKQADVLWFYMDTVDQDRAEIIVGDILYSLETRGKWWVLVRRTK